MKDNRCSRLAIQFLSTVFRESSLADARLRSFLASRSRNDRGQTRSRVQIQYLDPFRRPLRPCRGGHAISRSRGSITKVGEPTFTWQRLVGPGTSFSPSVPSSHSGTLFRDVLALRIHWFRFEEIAHSRKNNWIVFLQCFLVFL